jgi:cellulose synthase/poly-beta-1,6-N-acetylglucosamine synthase-like glycosyltransferase
MNKISVVIPTLGGKQLINTIEILNKGSVVPDEILVCVPEKLNINLDFLIDKNVRIIRTSEKGQVAQRAQGFREVKNEIVLQLDDDIIVGKEMLKEMSLFILQSSSYVIGPKFYDYKTNKYKSYLVPRKRILTFFENIMFFLLNGTARYEQGKISKAGVCMGVLDIDEHIFELDWLPGGCIMHHKKNLILNNFYPFTGKAYAEDLMHSIILRKNNLNLVRINNAICYFDAEQLNLLSVKQILKEIKHNTIALKYVVKNNNGSSLRLYFFLFFKYLLSFYLKLIKTFR